MFQKQFLYQLLAYDIDVISALSYNILYDSTMEKWLSIKYATFLLQRQHNTWRNLS